MQNVKRILENSKKPFLAKLEQLEKKKVSAMAKFDSEISDLTTKLEAIDNAIEALNIHSMPKTEVFEEAPQVEEIDPFEIKTENHD